MLTRIINTVELVGAMYLASKLGMRQAELEPAPQTGLETAKTIGVCFLIGAGVGACAIVTGPLGLIVAGTDVYRNRRTIAGWFGVKPKAEVVEEVTVETKRKSVQVKAVKKIASRKPDLSVVHN